MQKPRPQPRKACWAVDSAGEESRDKEIGGTPHFSPRKRNLCLLPSPYLLPLLEMSRGGWRMGTGLGVGACRPPAWPRVMYLGVTLVRGVKPHP